MEQRFAISPKEAKALDTAALREAFLIEKIFAPDEIVLTLSHYDRYIAGGRHASAFNHCINQSPKI